MEQLTDEVSYDEHSLKRSPELGEEETLINDAEMENDSLFTIITTEQQSSPSPDQESPPSEKQTAEKSEHFQIMGPDEYDYVEDEEEEGLDVESDRISVETDIQTVIMVEPSPELSTASETGTDLPDQLGGSYRAVDPVRAEAVRKLLTEPQRYQQSFQVKFMDLIILFIYIIEKNK